MTDNKPTLHHLNDSQSQRILWLLEELTIPYNLVLHTRNPPHDPRRPFLSPPSILALGSYGQAPILITGALDGTRTITESSAIATYLIRTFDTADNFGLCNGDWIRDEQLVSLSNVLGRNCAEIMMVEFGYIKGAKVNPLDAQALRKTLEHLERELKERPAGEWFMGARPGRADVMLEFYVSMLKQRQYLDLRKEFPGLDAWLGRIESRPAWKAAMEKGNGYDLNTFPKIGRKDKL
ncbi:hypothetical protein BJ878DRAFT_413168 [Calycina marina]|uniref:Glutathione S-transferase n=1 Tax=Calycina marina TaxID=1763456 RepID=A0A9P8CK66_9HELO|nr:hypothetical protein BJ878DRAFT_413168 [Calycina marina]